MYCCTTLFTFYIRYALKTMSLLPQIYATSVPSLFNIPCTLRHYLKCYIPSNITSYTFYILYNTTLNTFLTTTILPYMYTFYILSILTTKLPYTPPIFTTTLPYVRCICTKTLPLIPSSLHHYLICVTFYIHYNTTLHVYIFYIL